jgi:hypothetical protein
MLTGGDVATSGPAAAVKRLGTGLVSSYLGDKGGRFAAKELGGGETAQSVAGVPGVSRFIFVGAFFIVSRFHSPVVRPHEPYRGIAVLTKLIAQPLTAHAIFDLALGASDPLLAILDLILCLWHTSSSKT